jgi:Tfp pilus assembly protein PilO
MALLDNPKSASALAILLAALVGYAGYTGDGLSLLGLSGARSRTAQVQALQDTIMSLEASTDSAKRDLAQGSVEDIRRRIAEHRGTLGILRQFVPEQNEVPNLLDDISSRAKIRGVNLASVVPQAVEPGPYPFDTYAYEMSVVGRYDQIGTFLSDIASLRRIIVPTGVQMTAANLTTARALGDTTKAMLETKFKVRTYVKSGPGGADAM